LHKTYERMDSKPTESTSLDAISFHSIYYLIVTVTALYVILALIVVSIGAENSTANKRT
jgi:hypothetical protein